MTNKSPYLRSPAFSNKSSRSDESDVQQAEGSFGVHTIEELDDDRPSRKNSPCLLKSFEIIWITRGNACLMIDKQECLLDNSRICLVAPGRIRQLAAKGEAKGYVISLSYELLYLVDTPEEFFWLDVCIKGFSLPVFNEQQGDLGEMEDLALKMRKELEREGPTRTDVLKGLLKVFMVYFSRNCEFGIPKASSGRDNSIAKKYLSLVKKNFRTKKAVSDYAGELALSPNYLNQVVKRVSGFPARYHIQQSIISYAKAQALHSNLSMKEIADSLGFRDYSNFSKFFKNVSGMNFSSFRNGK
jgi:AraC family transcriptional activator of pobA